MKKQSPRFFFRLQPTNQSQPTQGSATHYAQHKGLVTLDPLVALHIADSVRTGRQPTVYIQGWWSPSDQVFTVGMAIPRSESTTVHSRPIATPSPPVHSLMELFTE